MEASETKGNGICLAPSIRPRRVGIRDVKGEKDAGVSVNAHRSGLPIQIIQAGFGLPASFGPLPTPSTSTLPECTDHRSPTTDHCSPAHFCASGLDNPLALWPTSFSLRFARAVCTAGRKAPAIQRGSRNRERSLVSYESALHEIRQTRTQGLAARSLWPNQLPGLCPLQPSYTRAGRYPRELCRCLQALAHAHSRAARPLDRRRPDQEVQAPSRPMRPSHGLPVLSQNQCPLGQPGQTAG